MRLQLCVDPKKRLIPGGKLPFKRAAKGKDKTRKQMQRMQQRLKALEKQVSGYMRINAELIDERRHLQKMLGRYEEWHARDSRLIAEYIEKIFALQAVLHAEGFRVSLRSLRGADARAGARADAQ